MFNCWVFMGIGVHTVSGHFVGCHFAWTLQTFCKVQSDFGDFVPWTLCTFSQFFNYKTLLLYYTSHENKYFFH